MGEEGPGAGPRAKGFSHARGWAGVQLLGRALEAEGGPTGQKQASHPIYPEAPGPVTLGQALGRSQPGSLILSIPKCLSFVPGPDGSTLAHPTPLHPSSAGKLCQERKEVGGRAGGIQGALLG